MNKPSNENFELTKIKFLHGQTTAKYVVRHNEGNKSVANNYAVEIREYPHTDFTETLGKFKSHFLDILGISRDKSHKQELMRVVTATGFELKEAGESSTVKITGKLEAANEVEVAINTPNLRYYTSELGIEEELAQDIEKMKDEVYAFIFEGKEAQQKIDFDEESEKPAE